jgi:hypothetical protein
LPGILDLGKCLVETPLQSEALGVSVVSSGVVWVQLDGRAGIPFPQSASPNHKSGQSLPGRYELPGVVRRARGLAARRHGLSV